MKRLSEFKQAIKLGVKVGCLFHKDIRSIGKDGKYLFKTIEKGVREVSIVQSKAFALRTELSKGHFLDSWCYYPKASYCQFEDNKMTIIGDDKDPIMTYWIEK